MRDFHTQSMSIAMSNWSSTVLSKEETPSQWSFRIMLLVAVLTYVILSGLFKEILNILKIFSAKTTKRWFTEPPMLPLGLPLLGHSLLFTYDVRTFSSTLKKFFQNIPIQINLSLVKPIILFNANDIIQVFKKSDIFSNSPYRMFVKNTFEVPKGLEDYYKADDSQKVKNDKEDVEDDHRVKYLMHKFIVQFMGGPNLLQMGERFTKNIVLRFKTQVDSTEWNAFDNLYDLVKKQMFRASVDAMFGERLFEMYPDFSEQFWAFESQVPELSKGLPKIMVRKAIAAREKCIQSVTEWNKFLEDYTEAQSPREFTTYDPVLGSELLQRRNEAFTKMPALNDRAKACDNLALIWASTANVIHAAYWLILELCRHPEDLKRFREEIKASEVPGSNDFKIYDMTKLGNSDLLQSMYAEILRLYVAMIVMRSPSEDVSLRDWSVKAGETIFLLTYAQHRDTNVFPNNSDHPINEFWADRFIVPKEAGSDTKEPTFSLEGYEGSWIPYGGGSHMCPGRHFAKQEMLLTVAVLLGNFDIELSGSKAEVNWSYHGTGAMVAKGQQKCRIRRL